MTEEVISNLQVASNLMVEKRLHSRDDELKFIPGDYVVEISPLLRDVRSEDRLTAEQRIEREQYLVCLKCGRPCAGTCEGDKGLGPPP